MADSATTFKDPQLTDRTPQPKGVLQKNLKSMLYMGAVGLLILATFISSRKKTPTAAEAAKNNPPQPYVQDNTANNVDALQRQLAELDLGMGLDRRQHGQKARLPAGRDWNCRHGEVSVGRDRPHAWGRSCGKHNRPARCGGEIRAAAIHVDRRRFQESRYRSLGADPLTDIDANYAKI